MAGVKGPRPCLGLRGKGDWPLSTRARARSRGVHPRTRARTHRRPRPDPRVRARAAYVHTDMRTHTRVCTCTRHTCKRPSSANSSADFFGPSRSLRSQNPALALSHAALSRSARVRTRVYQAFLCEVIFFLMI